MAAIVDALVATLNEQVTHHEAILKLIESQQDALVENNIDALEEIIREMEEVLLSLRDVENRRFEQHQQLCKSVGLSEDSSLGAILDVLPDKRLASCGEQLTNVIVRINEKQKQNKTLLTQSLNFVDFSLNLMTQVGDSQTYGKGGHKQGRKRQVLIKDM